ncbi:MAG: SRPBCC family protein [Spirillospora sp.]
MHFEVSVDIDATPATVWTLLTDVEHWPEITASINRVEILEKPFTLSSRARVSQPKLPPATWTVTTFDENNSFTWESHSPGVTTIGGHHITTNPDGSVSLQLTLDQKGPLAPIISLLTARLTRRYITMEANGLKTKAETLT